MVQLCLGLSGPECCPGPRKSWRGRQGEEDSEGESLTPRSPLPRLQTAPQCSLRAAARADPGAPSPARAGPAGPAGRGTGASPSSSCTHCPWLGGGLGLGRPPGSFHAAECASRDSERGVPRWRLPVAVSIARPRAVGCWPASEPAVARAGCPGRRRGMSVESPCAPLCVPKAALVSARAGRPARPCAPASCCSRQGRAAGPAAPASWPLPTSAVLTEAARSRAKEEEASAAVPAALPGVRLH